LEQFPRLFRRTQMEGQSQDTDDNFWSWLFYEKDFSKQWEVSTTAGETKNVISGGVSVDVNGRKLLSIDGEVGRKGDSAPAAKNQSGYTQFSNFVRARIVGAPAAENSVFSVNPRETPPAADAELVNDVSVRNEDDTLVEYMRVVEPRLEKLKYLRLSNHQHPYVYADVGFGKGRELIPATQLGQGFARVLHLFATLLVKTPKVLLIDEFENGLQHDALVPVWKALGKIARERDIQIFATTHSIENIRDAHLAFSESDPYDLNLIKLLRRKDKTVGVTVFDREMIETSLETNLEIR